MKLFPLGQFDGAADYGSMREFDVGIEKENVSAVGMGCAQVAAN
jgi:hypothetical protein